MARHFLAEDGEFPVEDGDFLTIPGDFPTEDGDFPAVPGEFPAEDRDFPTIPGDFLVEDGDFPAEDVLNGNIPAHFRAKTGLKGGEPPVFGEKPVKNFQ